MAKCKVHVGYWQEDDEAREMEKVFKGIAEAKGKMLYFDNIAVAWFLADSKKEAMDFCFDARSALLKDGRWSVGGIYIVDGKQGVN